MNKRFGILTYHNANNYGAVLQAYALQRFLKDRFGEDCVDVIDYQCLGVKRQRLFSYYIKGNNPIGWIVHFAGARKRIKNIESFCYNNILIAKTTFIYKILNEQICVVKHKTNQEHINNKGKHSYCSVFYVISHLCFIPL